MLSELPRVSVKIKILIKKYNYSIYKNTRLGFYLTSSPKPYKLAQCKYFPQS
jgi:hypothetical protein